jgi:adenylate kinase
MVTSSTTASEQARGQPQSRDSGPIRRSFWHRVIDAVFGYDFFVSYCWADGSGYAQKLAHRLAGEGFVVFFDRNDFVSGDNWQQIGDWTLRRTGKLVLVGTRQALTSVPVQREVRVFHDTGRRILPIDIGGTFESADAQSPLLQYISPEILSIKEPAEALERGPSDDAIATIRRSFNLLRQDKKRMRVFAAIAAALAILSVVSIVAAYQARVREQEAIRQRDRAQRALDRVDRAKLGIAVTWDLDKKEKELANKCYYYGDGGPIISVSDEYLARYQARGFSLNSLCMGLASAAQFDPESGKRLPTYILANLKKIDANETDAGSGIDESPLEVPDCFKRGLAYSDCTMNYDLKTGEKLSEGKTQAFRAVGRAIEQLFETAIREGAACSEFAKDAKGCRTFERWSDIGDADQVLVADYLAPEGYMVGSLSERLKDSKAKLPENLAGDFGVSFYDISAAFPLGFGYALNADGTASGELPESTKAAIDRLRGR